MLKRDIGKWGIVLLMLNNVIGAGIYGLPSKLFDLTNIYSLAILACCALIVFVFVLVFAEVASQFNRSGGAYLYVHEAYGKLPGFIVGWLLLIGRVAGFAAYLQDPVCHSHLVKKGSFLNYSPEYTLQQESH